MRVPILIDTTNRQISTETGTSILGYTVLTSTVQNAVFRGTFDMVRYEHFNIMKQLNGIA